MILTIYFWIISVIAILFTVPICFIAQFFTDQKTFARIYEDIPGTIVSYAMLIPKIWTLKIVDKRKKKDWKNQYVVISNHLSFIDSLVMGFIPLKKKYMIAQVFTKIPVFGWLTKKAGFVPADKNNPKLNSDAVDRAVQAIKLDNSSMVIYVEGQRERMPYKFEKFKTGAYRIARRLNLQILPITLNGTYEAMRFGGIVGFSDIVITIDEPFSVDSEDYEFYMEKSKQIFSSNLKLL